MLREDPAADAVARLDHDHVQAGLTKLLGCGETGSARAKHQHIRSLIIHVRLMSSR
jgi:hypothetical protein